MKIKDYEANNHYKWVRIEAVKHQLRKSDENKTPGYTKKSTFLVL